MYSPRRQRPPGTGTSVEISFKQIDELQNTIASLREQVANSPEGSLSTAPDVDLTAIQDGDTLIYDAASGKWMNGSVIIDLGGPQ